MRAWQTGAVRAFVGVWPPSAVLRAVSSMPRPEVAGLRWTTEPQWHVTVRFFGNLNEDDVAGAVSALGQAAEAVDGLPLAVAGPRTERLGQGVLCLPVAGLDELAAAVRDHTVGFGDHHEDRAFRGHLTLARGRGGRRISSRLAGVPLAGEWEVRELSLVRSSQSEHGSCYERVATVPLR